MNVLRKELISKGITVKYDNDDKQKPGWKFAEYELKASPLDLLSDPVIWKMVPLN